MSASSPETCHALTAPRNDSPQPMRRSVIAAGMDSFYCTVCDEEFHATLIGQRAEPSVGMPAYFELEGCDLDLAPGGSDDLCCPCGARITEMELGEAAIDYARDDYDEFADED